MIDNRDLASFDSEYSIDKAGSCGCIGYSIDLLLKYPSLIFDFLSPSMAVAVTARVTGPNRTTSGTSSSHL